MAVQTSYPSAPEIGLPGMLRDNGPMDAVTGINQEASAVIPFGVAVCFEGAARDDGMLLPDSLADVLAGISLRSLAYDPVVNTADGIAAGGTLTVLTRGRVYVTCEDGCSPGDRLHVRAVATGSEVEGACRASADGSDTIDATTQGVWRSTAAAGQLAALDVDFVNAPPA